jgi:hypothetical protein
MVILYHAGGAGDFSLVGEATFSEADRTIRHNAIRILRVREQQQAAEFLETLPFELYPASNHLNDEFEVLHATLPLERYEELRRGTRTPEAERAMASIANVFYELGRHVRFISISLDLEEPAPSASPTPTDRALTRPEIQRLVSSYIGVTQGYLGDFSYQSHHDFYANLDLDIDPFDYQGTTRERFIEILTASPPEVQARILQGILDRFPAGSSEGRTEARASEIRGWIGRLRGSAPVASPSLRVTSAIVDRALADAEQLIRTTGAPSGVDRVHTALHGYLREACRRGEIAFAPGDGMTVLLRRLREGHPALQGSGARSNEIDRILRSFGSVLDSMNPVRNEASVAHANEELLDPPEAMFVINAMRTILHYLDERLARQT